MSRQSHHPMTDELLVRFLSGEANDAEREKVSHWRDASEDNRHYFETFRWAMSHSRPAVATGHINEEEEWRDFKARVETGGVPRRTVRPSRSVWLRRSAIAAAFILLAGMGLMYLSTHLVNRRTVEFASGGQVRTETLPDGSGVTLNKNSALYYNRTYNTNNRDVRLTGEAFFAVAPNDRLPFVIHVRDVQVEVLGTSFNVLADPDKTAIVVETGEVRVKKDSQVIYLHAGEKLTVSQSGGLPVKVVNTDPLYNYYRTKKFICNGTPLRELVAALNNAYDQHISLADQRDGDLPITVTFSNNSAAAILDVVCSTLQLTASRQGDRIILKKRNASL